MISQATISMNDRKDNAQLHDQYLKNRYVHINDFLLLEDAKNIHRQFASQKTWNLVWNNNGEHTDMNLEEVERWPAEQQQQLVALINQQAKTNFQYFYAAIPIYDICYNDQSSNGFFNSIYELVNSAKFIEITREITGHSKIQFADVQATRYSSGHFLKEHDDNVDGKGRIAAYVLNLTPTWQEDWGGALVLNSEDQERQAHALFPSFNALNIFDVPRRHSVSLVTPFAGAARFSITGWLRS